MTQKIDFLVWFSRENFEGEIVKNTVSVKAENEEEAKVEAVKFMKNFYGVELENSHIYRITK